MGRMWQGMYVPSFWGEDAYPNCEKSVYDDYGDLFPFAGTYLCPSSTWAQCTANYYKGRNKIWLKVKTGRASTSRATSWTMMGGAGMTLSVLPRSGSARSPTPSSLRAALMPSP